jgi:integrase
MNKKNKKIIHKKVLRKPINKDAFEYLLLKIDELETEDIVKFNKKLLNVILYYTGLRISEVLLLNKKNIVELYNKGKFLNKNH